MIKLDNKKWISDQITVEDMMGWKMGDIITIEAGTGTGKSEFIKNVLYAKAKVEGGKILFLVHRDNCYDQFEKEIRGKEDVIKLMTYQTIDSICKRGDKFDFSSYYYIVSDEFHYFTSDSGFNNTTDYSLEAILAEENKVIIFMSATANLMQKYLKNIKKLDLISYVANIDFSFINNLYFYNNDKMEDIIINKILENDEKAIVFINHLDELEKAYLKYKDVSMFNCSKSDKKYKYVDEDKINKMLHERKFEEQLIFTTTVMDTGVSIKDEQVKHIICNNILDVNVLVQCIGRKRMESEDDRVNIYIKNIDNGKVNGHLTEANKKLEPVNFLNENGQEAYKKKYEREAEDKSVLYYKNDNVKRNDMAYFKLLEETMQYKNMLKDKYNNTIKDGYKKYIANLFDMSYETIDVEIKKQTLEGYLDEVVGIEMCKKERKVLIEKIGLKDARGRIQRSMNQFNEYFLANKLEYVIVSKKDRRRKLENGEDNPMRNKVYWEVIKKEIV